MLINLTGGTLDSNSGTVTFTGDGTVAGTGGGTLAWDGDSDPLDQSLGLGGLDVTRLGRLDVIAVDFISLEPRSVSASP